MGKRKMVAVLYLNNSWEWSGGYGFYLQHAGAGKAPRPNEEGYPAYMNFVAQYATNQKAHELFYDYVRFILSRTNRYTGVAYKDDPAIMSWQIGNEPRAFAKEAFSATYLIVGEPTELKMVSASKGTKSFDLKFKGEAFHSGYPQYGRSAVSMFVEFMNSLDAAAFPEDPLLGATTWNVGLLRSDNPQNVLSPELSCRIYFRTTFASDEAVKEFMARPREGVEVSPRGGDVPAKYLTIPGFASGPASFGTDAPHLSNFAYKAIFGAGSIRHAHRDDEQVSIRDLEMAAESYVRMFKHLY